MKNCYWFLSKTYRLLWLRKKPSMSGIWLALTLNKCTTVSSGEKKIHSKIDWYEPSFLTTIKHSCLGRIFASLIVLPLLIWYYKSVAYYYLSSVLMAIILKIPVDVIRAIRSPMKPTHFSPSTEAEWIIVVGKTLYTLWVDLEFYLIVSSFLNKFSFIFHKTKYPPSVDCRRYFIDWWRLKFRLVSHIIIVGLKCATATPNSMETVKILKSSKRAKQTWWLEKDSGGGTFNSMIAFVSIWKTWISFLFLKSIILMKPSSVPSTSLISWESLAEIGWLNTIEVIFPLIWGNCIDSFCPFAFENMYMVIVEDKMESEFANAKSNKSLV